MTPALSCRAIATRPGSSRGALHSSGGAPGATRRSFVGQPALQQVPKHLAQRFHVRAEREGDSERGADLRLVEPEQAEHEAEEADSKAETVGEIIRTRKQGKGVTEVAPESEPEAESALNKINPYVIGRKSRAAFDDVWSKFARLGSFATSMDFVDDVNDLEAPQAAYTTVLLLGATGRVGRVMLRKLLLRGYTVKVLSRDESKEFPKSVIVVKGDVGDYQQVRDAVQGVDKVIYCAGARSTLTADLARVEQTGVANVVKALQDQYNKRAISGGKQRSSRAKPVVAEFKKEEYAQAWAVEHVGPVGDAPSARAVAKTQDYASAKTNASNLQFTGAVYSRTGYAEVGAHLQEGLLDRTDGLLMRILGDGQPYTCMLETSNGEKYSSRFNTKQGFSTVRLPFNTFRPLSAGNDAPVNPKDVAHISIRFDAKRGAESSAGFKLEINFIKALPSGEEPDFVLISRTTQSSQAPSGDSPQQMQLAKVIDFKRKGEDALRNSGLSYTIIRAGELVEEPGGYKALLFDQSNRIQDSISCADLADICVKGLHEHNARNKTFDVCNENFGKEGLQQYELIAHLPDKSSNYIKSALSDLQSMS